MQDKPKYVSQPLQAKHLSLEGETWEKGTWNRPFCQVRVVQNNVRLEVYMNDPKEANRAVGDMPMQKIPIVVRTNYIAFVALLNRLEEICGSSQAISERMATKGRTFNYETGTADQEIRVTSVVTYGKDNEGCVFIRIEDKVYERNAFHYKFGNSYWHPTKTDEGELSKGETSVRYCKAWIESIKSIMFSSAYHAYIPEEVLRDERKRWKEERENKAKTATQQSVHSF